jgi:hypothetical protein
MLISEIINEPDDLDPSDDEIKNIRLDKQTKLRPKVRNMLFTDMPGNDSTYPAL